MDFNTGPKVPFPGVLDIGHFHSPRMKPCKSVDYFTLVSFHIVVDIRQGESKILQISTWKAFLLLKIYLQQKSDRFWWKPLWIRACPGESPTTSHCQVECVTSDCESRTFFIMNFLNFLW